MDYLLGLDIGTSGVKGILVSTAGQVVKSRTEYYQLNTPHPGWTEQNPADWWEGTTNVIKYLLANSGVSAEEIKGVSFSGQMHSSVFLDQGMEVIRPAILWSDTRTSKQCQDIYQRVGGLEKLIKLVSNPALEGFTAPKVLWLQQNEPENYQRVKMILLPKDYIRYRLTGEVQIDRSDGAGTIMMDIRQGSWSVDLLDRLGIERDLLPPLVNSTAIVGEVSRAAARTCGLKVGTPVVAGGADNACGAVGSGIIKEGRVMVSIGTSGVVVAQVEKPLADPKGRLHLFNHAVPENWYMMGVMLSAGMSFSWLKENLFADQYDYQHLNLLAAEAESGSEGLLFLPYLYGERTPHADANARGVFFGISGKHQQGHLVRSVMEGVSFGLRDSLELIKEQDIKINEIRAIGGGAKSKVWQQILADVFGQEIKLLKIEEGPALGAAMIAGVGVGVFKDFSEAEQGIIQVSQSITPNEEKRDYYNQLFALYQNLYQSLKDDFKKLT